jgi:hypothetical protein
MRDRYPRFFRSRRPPEAETRETDGTAFEAQVRAAFPRPAVPDALQARVAELCRAAAAPESQVQGQAAWRRRLRIRAAEWGVLGLVVVVLVAIMAPLWSGGAREVARRSLVAGMPAVTQAIPAHSPAPLTEVDAGGKEPRARTFASYGSAPVPVDRADLYIENHDSRSAGPPAGQSLPSASSQQALPGSAAPAAKPKPLSGLQESRPDRYLIRNATLTLEVRDARHASRVLIAAVGPARGYVAESHESVDELGRRSVVITVRVPAGRFDGSLAQVEGLGKVLDKQVTAEDVTEEFVDSQARLANLQQTEQRLRDHLTHTGRLSDILLVERELTRVRGEIEQLQGRLRYLSHRIAYSTLAVTLTEAPRPQPVVPPQSYSSGKVLSDAMRSLVAFGQTVWSGAIWIAVWGVVWVPVALAGWVAYRRRVGDVGW